MSLLKRGFFKVYNKQRSFFAIMIFVFIGLIGIASNKIKKENIDNEEND